MNSGSIARWTTVINRRNLDRVLGGDLLKNHGVGKRLRALPELASADFFGLKLTNHVGQRVSVTGTLVDREMQVRSLQRVAASCD